LQVLAEPVARQVLIDRYGIAPDLIDQLTGLFGISGICNVLGAIKTAKHYGFKRGDVIVTVATDALDRYHSVMADMAAQFGTLDEAATVGRVESIFHGMRTDWIMDGTPEARERWHNLKYYTWVEQQGKTVEELDAQRDPLWWIGHQQRVLEIDAKLVALRETSPA
jgi:hypothetical protein